MSGKRRPLAGLSLAEVLIAAGLFTLLSLALAFALKQSSKMWISNSSQLEASETLRKTAVQLEKDLPMAGNGFLSVTQVPPSLGSGYDGDAIWFLSHRNPTDGQAYLRSDGTPFWQCQVLYYCVVPNQVENIAGGPVTSGLTPDGYEDRCSYKVLIRKVIDTGPATDPTDESTQEELMLDPSPYLTRPNQHDTSGMSGEAGLIDTKIVATNLMYFRATPLNAPTRVEFDIRALSIDEQRGVARNPSEALLDSPYTLQMKLSVETKN